MNADKDNKLEANVSDEFLLKEETGLIIGCAFEVINGLGHGLNEKCYENALVVEFGLKQIGYQQQRPFNVLYKNTTVGLFVPDLVVMEKVIVDTKVIDRITDHERGQMLNYLRITRLPVGLIINFKHARLEWERVVLSSSPNLRSSASICG
jgi:GxxExxY protein